MKAVSPHSQIGVLDFILIHAADLVVVLSEGRVLQKFVT
jgi:hypothetical protein